VKLSPHLGVTAYDNLSPISGESLKPWHVAFGSWYGVVARRNDLAPQYCILTLKCFESLSEGLRNMFVKCDLQCIVAN
jgi:hypothetical protein